MTETIRAQYNTKVKKSVTRTSLLTPLSIVLFHFALHLTNLTRFPVFADEAIYIRWAQLIMDDWRRYLFFPMNDGKTPLFIWLLVPFQSLFADQLFAARIVSVLIGAIELFVIKEIVRQLGGRAKTQYLAMFLATILPFWYFHNHVALMDGMLTLGVSCVVLGLISLGKKIEKQSLKSKPLAPQKLLQLLFSWPIFTTVIFAGLSFGLALWTKLPALFALPVFFLFAFLPIFATEIKTQKTAKLAHATQIPFSSPIFTKRLQFLFLAGLSAVGGLFLFVLLRISPSFGQLFHRSSDFTYPIGEVLFHGKWRETLANIPTYTIYFLAYLTAPVLILSLAGLFSNRYRRTIVCFWLSALAFIFPYVLFGRVIYARYLFPAALFLTVACVLSLEAIYDRWISVESNHTLMQKLIVAIIVALALANTISQSLLFDGYILNAPDQTPFVSSDREQYLESWSSGQGILETTRYITQQAQNHTIAVATEGRFGTLPDGLLLYFHGRDVKNIYIEGTGEYPVKTIPDFFQTRAQSFDQSILVVNSDRMQLPVPQQNLISQFCRPNQKSCLQVWDITELVKKAEANSPAAAAAAPSPSAVPQASPSSLSPAASAKSSAPQH